MAVERGQAVQVVRPVVEWVRGNMGHDDVSYLMVDEFDACDFSKAVVYACMGARMGWRPLDASEGDCDVYGAMTQRVAG